MIVGPVFSSSVEAVKKIARKKKVNVISFTTSPTVLEEGVFSVGLLLKEQIERILTYAYDNKINNFVVIVPRITSYNVCYTKLLRLCVVCIKYNYLIYKMNNP